MDRRSFIQRGILLAGAMCVDLKSFAHGVEQMGKPKLKIGILSDVHIRKDNTLQPLEKAFRYFRDNNVDGVIIAGDMADYGLYSQLQKLADTWFKVFPDDKAPDGHHVERLFVYGNHDMEGYTYGSFKRDYKEEERPAIIKSQAISNDRAAVWKQLFHEQYTPFYIKDVKGYKFVGAHWANWTSMPGLDNFLTAHKSELVGEKPFFYFQHFHPYNTCSGPWAWGHDDGGSTKALSRFPNCIAFSGHSHLTLTDEKDLWQGSFISIGTSSLSYIGVEGARENTAPLRLHADIAPQMDKLNTYNGKQGMLMTVYSDYIIIHRREFVHDHQLGPDWVIPLPASAGKTLTFSYRKDHTEAPEFDPQARATVTQAIGKDRKGIKRQQLTIHFPSITSQGNHLRAYDYTVEAQRQIADVIETIMSKNVFSKNYYMSEEDDKDEVTCVFCAEELAPAKQIRFIIRPNNCFGKTGKGITTEWITIKRESEI